MVPGLFPCAYSSATYTPGGGLSFTKDPPPVTG
nr:MAG TPA: hypothetical protein [Caudoviricetes sp.]